VLIKGNETVTHQALGRALPVHFDMVALAGWGMNNPEVKDYLAEYEDFGFIQDEGQAVTEICRGRAGLIRMTFQDFGFNLAQWRMFFLDNWAADPEGSEKYGGWGYRHPYSFRGVDKIVLDGMNRPQRPNLVALAELAWPEELMSALTWYQKEWKDSEEPLWLAAVQEWPFE